MRRWTRAEPAHINIRKKWVKSRSNSSRKRMSKSKNNRKSNIGLAESVCVSISNLASVACLA